MTQAKVDVDADLQTVSKKSARAQSANDAQDVFWTYLDRLDRMTIEFKNDGGEIIQSPVQSRYHQDYAKRKYGAIANAERQTVSEYSDPHVAMLTLEGFMWDDEGEWLPPCDHYLALKESHESIRRAIRYRWGDDTQFFWVVAPNDVGYAHVHWVIYKDGPFERDRVEELVDLHVKNSPVAHDEDHPRDKAVLTDRLTDHKRRQSDKNHEKPMSGVGQYVAGQILALSGDISNDDSTPRNQKLFAMISFALGGKKLVGKSDSFGSEDGSVWGDDTSRIDTDGWQFHQLTVTDAEGKPIVVVDEDSVGGGDESGSGPEMVTLDTTGRDRISRVREGYRPV